jgi:choline dehydrogenase
MGTSSGDGRFDYVVVGAGSAGCVVAGRLTEDPDLRVLLLEAGGSDDHLEVHMPAVQYRLFKTEHDWNYTTAPEAELAGRRLYWPRGKLIGGSSSINAMLYVRGNRLDYDSWRDDYGCHGWGYHDLLPYFLRSAIGPGR